MAPDSLNPSAVEQNTLETTRPHARFDEHSAIAMDQEGTTSPTTDPSFAIPNGSDPTASKWHQLAAMDRQSHDFLPLLSELTDVANQSLTTELRDESARIALGALVEVFRDDRIPNEYERVTRSVMRTLAHDSCQLPSRYQVKPDTLSMENRVIAGGGSSDIREGKLGDKTVAVKTLRTRGNINAQNHFCKECIIWMSISHPHLLQLIAVDIDPPSGRYSMISEMMLNGNIKDYIGSNPEMLDRLRLLHEAAMGLHYLHEREIIHGDLKGHNILITNETPGRACLADFGLTTLTPNRVPGGVSTVTTGGTFQYMAPELLNPEKFGERKSRPTKPADIYAFGMVIYEVLTGSDPFYDQADLQLAHNVPDGLRPIKPSNAKDIGFGNGTWELVTNCWKANSTKRPPTERVLSHLRQVSSSSTDNPPTPQILYSDPKSILRSWRDIYSRDIKVSDEQLFAALVNNKKNRDIVLEFGGKNAATVINAIDKVLQVYRAETERLDNETWSNALGLLRILAETSRQIPKRYLVAKSAKYEVEKGVIASGGFADIRRGKLGGVVVAVKTIRASPDTESVAIYEAFCKECTLWMNISHDNVLQLLAVKVEPDTSKFSMISEMMTNGNIVNYIRYKKANRLCLLGDVARGLEYLHTSGVIHGDIKGSNILINSEAPPRACISDFGLSTVMPTRAFDHYMHKVAGGTFGYMAPELFEKDAKPSKEADIYSFGIVAYEVITGTRPFAQYGMGELLLRVPQGLRPARPDGPVPIGFGQGTWEFAERCWDGNPAQRPSAKAVLEHLKRVVVTSTLVEPGPGIPIHGPVSNAPSRPENSSGNSRGFSPPSANSPLTSPQMDVQLDPLDLRVLSDWQRLGSLNVGSPGYGELLRELVDVESNRKAVMEFTGDNAKIVINVIDEALRSGVLQRKLVHQGFILLRKLAKNAGIPPDSYLVSGGADFQVEETIFACGGFTDIRRGILAEKVVAVKTIRMPPGSDFSEICKDFCKESVLWMHASHHNILELIAINIDPQSGALSMISELMENGNIMDYISVNKANRIHLLNDVVTGLSYLHKCGIVHGDLKGTNILIKNGMKPQACICDFGFSTFTSTVSFAVSVTRGECTGTFSHMAPELLYPEKYGLRDCRLSEEADVYAFGMVVYEVLTGRTPFAVEKLRQLDIILRVMMGKRPRKPERTGEIGFGEGTWELVQRCWDQDRVRRPTMDEISNHFNEVVGNSSMVPPGPTMSAYEPASPVVSEHDSGSRGSARLSIPSQRRASDVQKPSLFERLGAHIKGRRPSLRLGAPRSPPP